MSCRHLALSRPIGLQVLRHIHFEGPVLGHPAHRQIETPDRDFSARPQGGEAL